MYVYQVALPMAPEGRMTAAELYQLSLPHKRTELVRGILMVREPAGFAHGAVAGTMFARLADYVRARRLGLVLAADTGFKIFSDPDTVRAPDVAFVSRERVPSPLPRGFAEFAPDLAVEILSPDDRPGEVLAKAGDWLEAGTRLVWVVNPYFSRARVYRADGSETALEGDGLLDGEDVIPGFACHLTEVLHP